MTKKEMIKLLQERERVLWLELDDLETRLIDQRAKFGEERDSTRALHDECLSRWCATYEILKELGIKPLDSED